MYPQQIIDALRHVRYPGNGKDLIESGMLEDDIRISGLQVSFSLIFDRSNSVKDIHALNLLSIQALYRSCAGGYRKAGKCYCSNEKEAKYFVHYF